MVNKAATPWFALPSKLAVTKLAKPKSVKLPVSSSVSPKFPRAQETMFRETLMLLNRCRVPYVVAGAFALQVHTGIWRFTKDIDLFLAQEDVAAAICCLKKDGFVCRVKDPVWLHKAHRDGFFVDLITGMSNAAITVERSWIENARPAMILNVRAKVLAAEELLVSKLFVVRRERFDGADVAHIVYATHGTLDWNRIFELVDVHWEMLLFALVLYRYVYPAYSHYVPAWVWRKLLGGFSEELSNRNSSSPFRGSLVDDKMFAIDVAEWGMEDILSHHRKARTQATRINLALSSGLAHSRHRKKLSA